MVSSVGIPTARPRNPATPRPRMTRKGRHAPPSRLQPLSVGLLGNRDVCRLESFRTLHQVELDLGAFGQGAETFRLDGRKVNEHVLAALGGDEAEALRIVEPLDCSGATHS